MKSRETKRNLHLDISITTSSCSWRHLELLADDVFGIRIWGKRGRGWLGKTMEGVARGMDIIDR